LAASLNMLYSAVNGKDVHPLARLMLFSGIAATVAANVLFGLPYGYIAAATSAWPALAFVGTVEMLVILIRGVEPKAAKASKLTDAPKAVSKYVAAMGKIGDALGGLRNEPITVPAELTTASVSGTRGRMRAPTRPRGKSSALSSHTGQRKPRSKATLDQAAIRFAPDLEAGRVPSLRTIQVGMHVGQPKATELQRGLADSVARTVR
jgi:hypothetical protein